MSEIDALSIFLESDGVQLDGELREIAKKVAPFATVVATTRAAVQARDDLRRTLPTYFTIRSKRSLSGIRSTSATKAKPWAWVGTIDPWMQEHVISGSRTRDQYTAREPGGASLSGQGVPQVGGSGSGGVPGRGPRKSVASKITKKWVPQALLDRLDPATGMRTTFVAPTRTGVPGVYQRVGRPAKRQRSSVSALGARRVGGKTRPARPVRLLWVLAPKITLKRRWPMDDIVNSSLRTHWREISERALLDTVQKEIDYIAKKAAMVNRYG